MEDIVVHHLDRSRSHRALFLLEELELPYTIKEYARDKETSRAPAALRDVHPLGKSPVVTYVSDGETITLAESGAIFETLAENAGALLPERGTEAFRRCRYFLHYAEGSLMPPLLVRLIFDKLRNAPLPFFIKPIVKTIVGKVDDAFTDPEVALQFSFLEQELSDREYLAGEFSVCDVQMSYPVVAGLARIGAGGKYPAVARYADRLKARPGYQRAIEKGGEVLL